MLILSYLGGDFRVWNIVCNTKYIVWNHSIYRAGKVQICEGLVEDMQTVANVRRRVVSKENKIGLMSSRLMRINLLCSSLSVLVAIVGGK